MPSGGGSAAFGASAFANGIAQGLKLRNQRLAQQEAQSLRQQQLDIAKENLRLNQEKAYFDAEDRRINRGLKGKELGLKGQKNSADEVNNLRLRYDQLTDTELKYSQDLQSISSREFSAQGDRKAMFTRQKETFSKVLDGIRKQKDMIDMEIYTKSNPPPLKISPLESNVIQAVKFSGDSEEARAIINQAGTISPEVFNYMVGLVRHKFGPQKGSGQMGGAIPLPAASPGMSPSPSDEEEAATDATAE